MPVVEQEAQTSAPSFGREGKIVRELATDAGPTKQFILGQAQTWLDAFRLFVKLENVIGFPQTKRETNFYFQLLSILLTSGEYLSTKLDGRDRVLIEMTGVSKQAFDGCVESLRESRDRLNRGLTSEEAAKICDSVFDAPVAA